MPKLKVDTTEWRWTLEHSISCAAAVIAACALILSVNESCAARKHARKAVQPYFEYVYFYNESGAGWRLMNSGLGPARLRAFRIQVDGRDVDDFNMLWAALHLPGPPAFRFTNPRVGDRFAPGHENFLFWVEPGPAAAALQVGWTHVNLEACYCSLFDECWLVSTQGNYVGPEGQHKRDDKCSPFENGQKSRWWQG
ncbi:MAG TPA: hypothetical protein VFC25_09100 [Verrucomicrobiae bacterium]|nr:hypothetical protein [Verrucomicrobiae bacterium]